MNTPTTHPAVVAKPPALSRRRFLRITAAAGAVAAAGALASAATGGRRSAWSEARTLMGTRVTLSVVADHAPAAREAMDLTFGAMERLIDVFDHRRPDTALAALNRAGYLASAPQELVGVVRRAVAYGDASGGAFDVTVKPVLDARRVGAGDARRLLHRVDYRQIETDGDWIRLGIPGAAITLDGIAKGRVIDEGVDALYRLGFDHVLVEAGGDLRTSGGRADGGPWRVGIAHPRRADAGELLDVVQLRSQAAATSGDYMHALTADFGQHHIVDPRTGLSPAELSSATAFAASAMDADALSTTLMVLGCDAGRALAERLPGVGAVLVTKELRVFRAGGMG